MINTITKPKLIAIVKPTEHTQKPVLSLSNGYLAHIRRRINAATSERERAGLAIIALALQAELKESK